MYLNVDNLHKPGLILELVIQKNMQTSSLRCSILLNLGFILFMDGINTA